MGRHALTAPSKKDRSIIKLCEQRLTYQEIGERVSLTRQRVEQVLKRWRPELARRGFVPRKPGFGAGRIEKRCAYCHKEFGSWLVLYAAKRQRYCSRSCAAIANQAHKSRVTEAAVTALEMRPKGKTWAEIAALVGITTDGVIKACLAYERRTGVDMSAAFPRRRKPPEQRPSRTEG